MRSHSIPCCIISMEVIFNLGLALALGLLVGVERGWQEREAAEGSRLAGIRYLRLDQSARRPPRLAQSRFRGDSSRYRFSRICRAHGRGSRRRSARSHDYGVTTLIAALITFTLGALSVRGEHAATAAVPRRLFSALSLFYTAGCSILSGRN
jgi:hypothetical protein